LTTVSIITDESSFLPCPRKITLYVLKKGSLPQEEDFMNNYQIKDNPMPELKLKQLQYETDTWKRLLGFMMEENIHQKNRISEILKSGFDKNLLEEIESFHTRFIKQDELIGWLRHELVELDKLPEKGIFEDEKNIKDINRRLNKLRNNILTAESQFCDLQLAFNNFLSEIFITSEK